MYSLSLPFERGYLFADSPGSSDWESCLGQRYVHRDTENATGRPVITIAVRNESGGALVAGQAVKWTPTEVGISVAGHSDPGGPLFAGFVDDAYATTGVTVAANAIFYLVVDGPSDRFGDTNAGRAVVPDMLKTAGLCHGFFDHFHGYVAGANWAITTDAGGSQALQDVAGGVLLLTSDSTDEDETILATGGAQFLFAEGKTIYFGAKVKMGEASTDQNNVVVGLVSGAVASAMGDSGAGLPASYTGAAFYKKSGETVWQAETSLAGTQNTDTDIGARSTSAYVTLNAIVYTTSSTSATAKFYLDGTLVYTSTFTYTSAAQMRFMVGTHNGSANAETLYIDYAYCYQII